MRPDTAVCLVIAARCDYCGGWVALVSDAGKPVVCGIGLHRPGSPIMCPGRPASLWWCQCLPLPLAYPRPDDCCRHLLTLALHPAREWQH